MGNTAQMGWVYVVTNKALPGLVKIGFTTRRDVNKRLREFDQAGLPYPYELAYKVWVAEPQKLEKRVHQFLTIQRENKEWFRCSVERATEAIDHLGPVHRELILEQETSPEPNNFSDSEWPGYSEEPNDQSTRKEPTRREENRVALWGVSVTLLTLVAIVVVWWKIIFPVLVAIKADYIWVILALAWATLKIFLSVFQYVGNKMERYRRSGSLPANFSKGFFGIGIISLFLGLLWVALPDSPTEKPAILTKTQLSSEREKNFCPQGDGLRFPILSPPDGSTIPVCMEGKLLGKIKEADNHARKVMQVKRWIMDAPLRRSLEIPGFHSGFDTALQGRSFVREKLKSQTLQ